MATKLVNALARQRVLAKVVDTLVPALAVLVAYLLDGGTAALLSAGVVVLLYWIAVLAWESTTGRTPGNLALGLVTVSAAGTPPGVVAALVRALALGVSSIVPVIGPLVLLISNTWDRDGQRRGWHDKLVGTYVLDVRAGRDPLRTGGLAGETVPSNPENEATGAAVASGSRQDHAFAAAGTPPRTEVPALSGSTAPGPPAPFAPIAPSSGWAPCTPGMDVELSPVPAEASAASSSGSGSGAAVDGQRVLVFDDGTEVEIAGQALIGRNPEPRPNEAVNYLINFADLNRSVSKTHVHLGFDQGAVWVTDRGSTNGSFLIDQTGSEQPLHPEVAMLLPGGSSVRFGDRRFTIR
ncbi:putative RDD family membrane protein YckC [Arthrobacter sp. PL16]|uniref:RDD family protein n=1 Tax=Arthrobacter sp. PL16 TaxID=3071720 RepID=UPI002DFC2BFB|nr:putative RDD family membrane protein YckC [Arthrobacter sp. PL16]